jgi:beta-1,4-mannosyltransferase
MHGSSPNDQSRQITAESTAIKAESGTQMTVYFAPQYLSVNPYQQQLAKALEKLGIQVNGIGGRHVFLPTAITAEGTTIVHLHWLHNYFRTPEFSKIPALKFLQLPFAAFTLSQFIVGLIILKFIKIKIVWTAHNLASHETLFPRIDYFCRFTVAHLADSVIAHCDAAKDEIINNFQIKNINKVSVVYHGNYVEYYENSVSKSDARQTLGLTENDLVFLFLGLIRPYKGVLELIEAFLTLESIDKQLTIAGRVAGKSVDDTFAKQIQLKSEASSQIMYRPEFVPDDKIQVYMNACDIVVFPYRDVLTSGAVVLAMSFGKPCIAPKKGCIGETLNESGAFLYDPAQDNGLSEAMNQALVNRAALSQMGQYNQQAVEAWNWDAIAQQTDSIYRNRSMG